MARADKNSITEYLLGRLTETEEEQVELRLLTDPEFAEEYDIVVNEIVDDYVAGKFKGEDLKQIEEYFFKSPERKNKLRFAQALKLNTATADRLARVAAARSRLPSVKTPRFYYAVAAAVLLALMVGVFWVVNKRISAPETVATINLSITPGTRGHGAEVKKLSLNANVDSFRIILELPEAPPPAVSYRAELSGSSGDKRSLVPVAQGNQSVTVVVRAAELLPGQYSLKLLTVSADGREFRIPGNYFFVVE